MITELATTVYRTRQTTVTIPYRNPTPPSQKVLPQGAQARVAVQEGAHEGTVTLPTVLQSTVFQSASRPTVRPDVNDSSMMDGYRTAQVPYPPSRILLPIDNWLLYRILQESMINSTAGSIMSPIRIETGSSYRNPADTYRIFPNDGYRSANSTQRALFSQQGAAPLPRARSSSMSRYGVGDVY